MRYLLHDRRAVTSLIAHTSPRATYGGFTFRYYHILSTELTINFIKISLFCHHGFRFTFASLWVFCFPLRRRRARDSGPCTMRHYLVRGPSSADDRDYGTNFHKNTRRETRWKIIRDAIGRRRPKVIIIIIIIIYCDDKNMIATVVILLL